MINADFSTTDAFSGQGEQAAGAEAPAFDLTAALERIDGDAELFAEMVELFLEDCPQLLAEIDEALADGDGDKLIRAAHTLKGAVANFEAAEVVEAARSVETAGRAGNLAEAQESFAHLRLAASRLAPALEKHAGQGSVDST